MISDDHQGGEAVAREPFDYREFEAEAEGWERLPFGALWCACDRHVMRRPIGFGFDGSGIGSNEVKDFWMGNLSIHYHVVVR